MVTFAYAVVAYLRALFLTRHRLALEAVVLRQQLAVFKRKQPRPKLDRLDRLFWIVLRQLWDGWSEALIIVKPETVVSWHRAGFRLFWRWRSQPRRPGRPKVHEEIRQLIRRMKAENPTWGAPRIHGELLQLGFEISEPTVSRYLVSLNGCRDGGQSEALASLSQQPPRGNRRVRLLYGCEPDVSHTLLLLCHRARSPTCPALQCHAASDERMDRTATA